MIKKKHMPTKSKSQGLRKYSLYLKLEQQKRRPLPRLHTEKVLDLLKPQAAI